MNHNTLPLRTVSAKIFIAKIATISRPFGFIGLVELAGWSILFELRRRKFSNRILRESSMGLIIDNINRDSRNVGEKFWGRFVRFQTHLCIFVDHWSVYISKVSLKKQRKLRRNELIYKSNTSQNERKKKILPTNWLSISLRIKISENPKERSFPSRDNRPSKIWNILKRKRELNRNNTISLQTKIRRNAKKEPPPKKELVDLQRVRGSVEAAG